MPKGTAYPPYDAPVWTGCGSGWGMPGAHRFWHQSPHPEAGRMVQSAPEEDEFVYVVSGEVVMVTDAGEEVLRPGDCAAFSKNDGNGHHLINRSSKDALVLEIGTRSGGDYATYPDIDLLLDPAKGYIHKDGTPYS